MFQIMICMRFQIISIVPYDYKNKNVLITSGFLHSIFLKPMVPLGLRLNVYPCGIAKTFPNRGNRISNHDLYEIPDHSIVPYDYKQNIIVLITSGFLRFIFLKPMVPLGLRLNLYPCGIAKTFTNRGNRVSSHESV